MKLFPAIDLLGGQAVRLEEGKRDRVTVFHAEPVSAASVVPDLLARGVARFRVEMVRETREEARELLATYRALLDGRLEPREALARAGAASQVGVSPAPMSVMA